ncbi:MAG TPA: ribonuclease H family protein [Flavobacterium sp.]|nr:ribonuclease H family protein [Flavobacterium sp.]
MAKIKFYVVWKGRQTGVFNTWAECQQQTNGFPQAVFKSFETLEQAQQAYNSSSYDFIGKTVPKPSFSEEELTIIGSPIEDSIAVDGAWNNNTGIVEYQGVFVKDKKSLFSMGPFEDGTINIVEFLAIVHALAHCKKYNIPFPIYSDSVTAISWVRDKQTRTNHEPSDKNKKLFELMNRAIKWLQENEYENKILKWESKVWGENPADFGRK